MADIQNFPVPDNHYAIVVASCLDNDFSGLQEWISSQIQSSLLVEEGPVTRMTFSFPKKTDLEWVLFKEAAYSLGCTDLSIHYFEEKDWQELWKEQGFKRFQVLGSLTVVPAWDRDPVNPPSVVLDPHLAFGTGWHETTHRCLELLVRYLPGLPDQIKVLDFGAGTGILGLSALKLHSGAFLTAIDNDLFAVEATTENLTMNQLQHRAKVYASWEAYETDEIVQKTAGGKESFSMILANVTGGVILSNAINLWNCLTPGGVLIISGVSEEERQPVESALNALTGELEVLPGERYATYCLIKNK